MVLSDGPEDLRVAQKMVSLYIHTLHPDTLTHFFLRLKVKL